jgi:hypothetical protein
MARFVTAGAGFLLAVLWFDLMHDVQVLGRRERELPEDVLASIAGYYRRVTTAARPMNRLVAFAMVATLVSILAQLLRGDVARWVGWASLLLAGAPVSLAGAHTVGAAVRLGTRADTVERQSELARAILRDHVVCLVSIAALLTLQLAFGTSS